MNDSLNELEWAIHWMNRDRRGVQRTGIKDLTNEKE